MPLSPSSSLSSLASSGSVFLPVPNDASSQSSAGAFSMGDRRSPSPTSATSHTSSAAAKLKRVLVRRRKPGDDQLGYSSGTDASVSREDIGTSTQVGQSSGLIPPVTPRRPSKLKLATTHLQALSNRKASPALLSPSSPSPPSPPPKPSALRAPTILPASIANKLANRNSALVPSPSINAAIEFIMEGDNSRSKDEKRKSDSTTASGRTLRPGGTAFPNNRDSVSGSSVSRRLSLLIPSDSPPPPQPPSATTKRRSISFHSGFKVPQPVPQPAPSPPEPETISRAAQAPMVIPATSPAAPRSAQVGANGIISGSNAARGGNIRGRLAAWTATASGQSPNASPLSVYNHLPPPSHPQRAQPGPAVAANGVVSSLGPAASAATGLAMNLSKRVHERVNGLWGYNASKSPAAQSSKYSSNSSSSSSDAAVHVGKMVRGPVRRNGKVTGRVVFGKPLEECVRDTKAIILIGGDSELDDRLEARFIPALVLRCVQHLMRWGMEEEGLFRITGRALHVSRLRTQFDTGADFDLRACSPGDLDPHAVSSVFKAYLRELPEAILTHSSSPAFDLLLSKANVGQSGHGHSDSSQSSFGMALGPNMSPSPKPLTLESLSLPPPTSTALTAELLREFRILINALPRENRDLLLTIVELLAHTAACSRTTKMPLSNLLLVFCPSLNMNPALLKIIVEHREEIFKGPLEEDHNVDVSRKIAEMEQAAAIADVPPARPRPPKRPDPLSIPPETEWDYRQTLRPQASFDKPLPSEPLKTAKPRECSGSQASDYPAKLTMAEAGSAGHITPSTSVTSLSLPRSPESSAPHTPSGSSSNLHSPSQLKEQIDPPSSPSASWKRRIRPRRPSVQLFFKRSAEPSSPTSTTPSPLSGLSVTSENPPVLSLSIPTGFSLSESTDDTHDDSFGPIETPQQTPVPTPTPTRPVSVVIPSTPIANLFRGSPGTSGPSIWNQPPPSLTLSASPPPRLALFSTSSSRSLHSDYNTQADDEEDDWANSVLLAAGADGRRRSGPRVRDAVRVFEATASGSNSGHA